MKMFFCLNLLMLRIWILGYGEILSVFSMYIEVLFIKLLVIVRDLIVCLVINLCIFLVCCECFM